MAALWLNPSHRLNTSTFFEPGSAAKDAAASAKTAHQNGIRVFTKSLLYMCHPFVRPEPIYVFCTIR